MLQSGTYIPLGQREQSSWTLNADGSLTLVVKGGDDYLIDCWNPATSVTAQCGSGDNSLAVVTEGSTDNGCTWQLTFNAADMCSGGGDGGKGGGLSGGWIFIIILIVVSFVYCVGGAMFMRYRRGASGVEMVPNWTFWKDLPGLVRDGCSFSWQKTRALIGGARSGSLLSSSTGSTYETI